MRSCASNHCFGDVVESDEERRLGIRREDKWGTGGRVNVMAVLQITYPTTRHRAYQHAMRASETAPSPYHIPHATQISSTLAAAFLPVCFVTIYKLVDSQLWASSVSFPTPRRSQPRVSAPSQRLTRNLRHRFPSPTAIPWTWIWIHHRDPMAGTSTAQVAPNAAIGVTARASGTAMADQMNILYTVCNSAHRSRRSSIN